ncbi:type IV secretion system protein [Variovorax saccharolyticus]|uniref:type IV secretion system protein n=1 Tax=Variovorax saccharolyticus TaxID=3053516 RepID=UPI0025754F07|nr:type IV secretion system protein [Variovorax sp. J31P216]MDM0029128.1 type IV secretion system protein [Variovorax sp. J31P216]
MDEAAPLTWLIAKINELLSSGAESTAAAISSTIAPLASVCFGIYILLVTINYMRGAESDPVTDFLVRCMGFAVVIGLGLNADNYANIVIPVVTGFGGDLANAVSGGNATAGTLDQLALFYLKIMADGFDAVGVFEGLTGAYAILVLKCMLILAGLVPFLVACALAIIVANVGSLLVAMVGPLYFAFLLFPATRQYFSAWLNTALSYALIPMMVAVIATLSVSISKQMLTSGGTLKEATFKIVFLASLGNLTLLYVLKTVSALASSLSAGGINAAMPGGIGSAAHAMGHGIRGSAREIKTAHKGYKGIKKAMANRGNSIRKAG